MAIVDNFWLKGQKKKLGGSVIYQAMGQTRQRALATSISNPRTQAQMNQRVKWANLVNLYRANQSWMKYAFETKKETQSDYNKFMSLNVTNSNIFLTKDIAAAGGCVVQAYQITQGSLPSIESTYDPNKEGWVTNIYLGPDVQLNLLTVAEFTDILTTYNPAIQEGDQLSFIRLTQLTNVGSGTPYVIVRKYEVRLSSTNNNSVWDYLPHDYLDSDEDAEMSALQVKDSGNAGGFVLILSRTIGGKTYVSSQRIVVANNSAIISAYSSQAALNAAVASYGESNEPFLSSTSAGRIGSTYVPNSIVSVRVGTENIVPGAFWNLTKAAAAQNVQIGFSSDVSGEDVVVEITYLQSNHTAGITLTNVAIANGKVTGVMPPAGSLPSDAAAYALSVTIDDGTPIETGFTIPNAYTIEGLE